MKLNFLNKLFGSTNDRKINALRPIIEKINGLEKEIEKLSDNNFAERTNNLKKIVDLISPFLSLVLFAFCGFYTIFMIEMGLNEHSPTLHVIMAIPFLSMLILSLSITYFSFLAFLKKIKFWKS